MVKLRAFVDILIYAASAGAAAALLVSVAHAQPVAVNQISVTCSANYAISTNLLPAGAAKEFIRIHVPSNAAATVWVNWDSNPAVTAPPSEDLAPGATVMWSGPLGALPSGAISCIATSPVTVTLEYK